MIKKLLFLFILFSFIQSTASYDLENHALNPNKGLISSIVIDADEQYGEKIRTWLHEVAQIPKGKATLAAIATSPHTLTIKHSASARLSAGRTIAPMTSDLINGIGADVTILFDARMPDQGTHIVFSGSYEPIEFTAVQNLYHELAHAMHQMKGTWRYFASEKQAIEEENIFRKELAAMQGKESKQRFYVLGQEIDVIKTAQSE